MEASPLDEVVDNLRDPCDDVELNRLWLVLPLPLLELVADDDEEEEEEETKRGEALEEDLEPLLSPQRSHCSACTCECSEPPQRLDAW